MEYIKILILLNFIFLYDCMCYFLFQPYYSDKLIISVLSTDIRLIIQATLKHDDIPLMYG